VRSGTGDDTTLFENDLNDILFVGRREDGIENLFRRPLEDTLGALPSVEDVERVDNFYERDSAKCSIRSRVSSFSVMCAFLFREEGKLTGLFIGQRERVGRVSID